MSSDKWGFTVLQTHFTEFIFSKGCHILYALFTTLSISCMQAVVIILYWKIKSSGVLRPACIISLYICIIHNFVICNIHMSVFELMNLFNVPILFGNIQVTMKVLWTLFEWSSHWSSSRWPLVQSPVRSSYSHYRTVSMALMNKQLWLVSRYFKQYLASSPGSPIFLKLGIGQLASTHDIVCA